MEEYRIKLDSTDKIKEFVNEAEKCDFDIDVFYNSRIIDGKSILGLLAFDLSNEIIVNCHGNNIEFERTLRKFQIR